MQMDDLERLRSLDSRPAVLQSFRVSDVVRIFQIFWVSADYDSKIRLQEILFRQGILYDKEIADYRTTSVNVIIELTRLLSNNSGEEKRGQQKKFSIYPLQYLRPESPPKRLAKVTFQN